MEYKEQVEEKPISEYEKMKRNSCSRFRTFIDTYYAGIVTLVSGVQDSTRDILEQNVLDRNFKFAVPYYSDGTEKIYFSLAFILADAVYRNTDLDTKNIQIKSDNLKATDWCPLLRGAIRHELKTSGFNVVMNDIRKELIDMGHVLTKEVNGETKIVNLINVVRPAEEHDLQDVGLAEITLPYWHEMLANKEEWEDNWEAIEQLKDVLDSLELKRFKVYEFWTYDYFKVGGEYKYTKGCIKFLDCTPYDEAEGIETPLNWEPYVELERFACPDKAKVTNKRRLNMLRKAGLLGPKETEEPLFPYEEQQLIRVPGRKLGMGFYELLRQEAKAFNRTMNEKLRYDELLHKGVLVHTKAPFSSNQKGSGRGLESDIINRIQTGTMISIKSGEKIDRLNLGSLTADFLATADKWFELARKKAGVSETAAGDPLPSSTPATTAAINEKQAKNAFDIVNEQQGIFFERLFTKFKIREIVDDITRDEWTKIIGDPEEFKQLEEAFIENLVNTQIPIAVSEGRIVPQSSELPPEEIEKLKEAVTVLRGRQGDQRMAQFKKAILDEFEFAASIYVINEAFDKQQTLAAIQDAINSVITNPMSELDADKMLEAKMDLMEIDTKSFRKSPERIQQEREMAMMEEAGIPAVNSIGGSPAKATQVEPMAKSFGQNNRVGMR